MSFNLSSRSEWSLRNIVRYSVVLLAGVIAGGRAVSAVHLWQNYSTLSGRDPSAADAFLASIMNDMAVLVLSVVLAGLLWWLLQATSADGTSRRS